MSTVRDSPVRSLRMVKPERMRIGFGKENGGCAEGSGEWLVVRKKSEE